MDSLLLMVSEFIWKIKYIIYVYLCFEVSSWRGLFFLNLNLVKNLAHNYWQVTICESHQKTSDPAPALLSTLHVTISLCLHIPQSLNECISNRFPIHLIYSYRYSKQNKAKKDSCDRICDGILKRAGTKIFIFNYQSRLWFYKMLLVKALHISLCFSCLFIIYSFIQYFCVCPEHLVLCWSYEHSVEWIGQYSSCIRRCTYATIVVVQSHSCVWLFVAPWTAACWASLFFTVSWSLLKLMFFEPVKPVTFAIVTVISGERGAWERLHKSE